MILQDRDTPTTPLPLLLALTPLLVLFGTIVAGVFVLGFDADLLLIAILWAAASATIIAMARKARWEDIQREAGSRLAEALPALLILLSIGGVIGSWTFSGTIPWMIVLGIELIDPQFLALTAFVATAMMSLMSGTSWGSAGTMGVSLMAVAQAVNAPLAPVAGAVVSGAYLGDKLSPLSDMTNIAAIGAGSDLYRHVRHMLHTSIGPAIITVIVFSWIGMTTSSAGTDLSAAHTLETELETLFPINALCSLPLLVAVGGIAMRGPPLIVLASSSVLALFMGVVIHGFPVSSAVSSYVSGFQVATIRPGLTPSVQLAHALNRGGLFSMAPTLIYVLAAFLLAASMQVAGAIDRLLRALLSSVRSPFGLITATMCAGAMMVALTSHGGVTSLIVGGLFRRSYAERQLAPENLSRAIEDSVTITEPLMPWTVSGLYMASTLGVATSEYLPWSVFCLLGPIFSLGFALTYEIWGIGLKPADAS